MKSNTPVLLSIAVAVVGAVAVSIFSNVDGALFFAAGSIICGFAIQFVSTSKSTSSSTATAATDVDFATTTLYVGNLPYRANEMAIRTLFAEQGKVISVRLMKDKHTGKRRGFGFVEMPEADAAKAIEVLNEQEFQERSLKVREANERTPREEASQ